MAPLLGRRRPTYRALNPGGDGEHALVAAGFKIKQRDADTMRRLIQPWQVRAFTYYDTIPEIKYASLFYSRGLAPLRLYAAERDDEGHVEPTENQEAIAQLARIQDPGGGGREGLLSAYGKLMFIVGEGLLFCSRERGDDGDDAEGMEMWEMLSTDELRVTGTGYTRYKAPAMLAEEYMEPKDSDYEPVGDSEAIAYRLWKKHPRFSFLADATMQGVLDICEEIYILTMAVRARARSRLAGPGILLVNGRYIPAPNEAAPGEDPQADPFMDDLIKNFTAGLANTGSASTQVPHVIRVDVPDGKLDDVMKHIQVIDPMQFYPETGLRYELIRRLAVGLDMPPEALLGAGDLNHWTSWQIDEQSWKSHLQPIANQLVYDLTAAYFQPSLREAGVADWQKYVIAYDATAVINHPDRSKDAKDAHDRGVLSDVSLLEALGFSEDDLPSEEEMWRFIGIKLRDGSYVKYGEPSKLGLGGILTGKEEILAPGEGETTPATSAEGGTSPDAAKEPPERPEESAAARRGEFAFRVLGASELAAARARDLAGARLSSLAKRDPALRDKIAGLPTLKVPHAVGKGGARALGAPTERQLVSGCLELLRETLRQWQVDPAFADRIIERVEKHAAATLYSERPSPLPPAFTAFVVGLLADDG